MNEKELNEMPFEAAMDRLEQIVRMMEKGEAPLKESLQLFEEGTTLVRKCSEALDAAQLRITQMQPDGTETEAEFHE